MRWLFPALLSLTGGYADTSGFLALNVWYERRTRQDPGVA